MKKIDETIILNLRKRAEEKSMGYDSGIKTCLIVQGGGMRGSYSMGALLALEEMGFNNSFDYVLGSSAGAINGAYFVAGQSKIATQVYQHYLTNDNFINFFRPWRVMDSSFLVNRFLVGLQLWIVARYVVLRQI